MLLLALPALPWCLLLLWPGQRSSSFSFLTPKIEEKGLKRELGLAVMKRESLEHCEHLGCA